MQLTISDITKLDITPLVHAGAQHRDVKVFAIDKDGNKYTTSSMFKSNSNDAIHFANAILEELNSHA